jgi:sugar/nucleoside kinase (ribokinase family)
MTSATATAPDPQSTFRNPKSAFRNPHSHSPRSGILAAGNWIIDHVKLLDAWPAQDALANILSQTWGNGGSPYNILKDLAKLGAPFPLAAIGLIGDDADGRRILEDCRVHKIDTAQLHTTSAAPTSYSDVMTDSRTGRRTFFHQRGANALLAPEHFDFAAPEAATAKIFHLGYILLLDKLDELIPAGTPVGQGFGLSGQGEALPCAGAGETSHPRASEVLRRARAAGLVTSLDCVSETAAGDRFQTIVRPVLCDVDILFVNDFEAGRLTGIDLHSAGRLNRADVGRALRALLGFGVGRWVIFHAPEAVCAASPAGALHWQPSVNLSQAAIKGTAGAGDAFAAGVLHALHEDAPIADAIRLGVCAAAACLASPTCSASILPLPDTLALADRYGFRDLPPSLI